MTSGLAALLVVLAAAGICAVAARLDSQAHRLSQAWGAAAQQLGLEFQQVNGVERVWRGQFDGVLVHAALGMKVQNGSYPLRLSAGAAALPRSLQVYADSLLSSLGRLVDGRDEAIGDAAFDDMALLPALDAHACAALSHGTRGQLGVLLRRGGHVRESRVILDLPWGRHSSAASLEQQVRWLCKLARSLSVPPGSLHERLARNALQDPAPAVRLSNLRFLAAPELCSPRGLLDATARALLDDVHPPVRLLAAQLLPAEGLPVLRALLAPGQPRESTDSALAVLQPRHADTLHESVLGCTSSGHESVRAGAARVLGMWARPPLEPPLVALLSDPSPRVQLAAAQALGRFGSAAAVEHLLPIAQALLDSELRQAARAAVGRIQSRLGDVEAGRLSLAEPQPLAGALTLADPASPAHVGLLSLDPEEGASTELEPRRGETG